MAMTARNATLIGAAFSLAVCVVVVATKTSVGTMVTRGTSHVLYADSILSVPRAIRSIEVTVQASSSYDGVTGNYTYTYTVTNESGSTGSLRDVAPGS